MVSHPFNKKLTLYKYTLVLSFVFRVDIFSRILNNVHLLSTRIPRNSASDSRREICFWPIFFCSPLGETIEAQKHDEVSMLFSDIVGFTSICSTASPLTVIDMLQDLYTKFDAFCGFLDIYKVSFLRLLVNIRRASNDDGWSRWQRENLFLKHSSYFFIIWLKSVNNWLNSGNKLTQCCHVYR